MVHGSGQELKSSYDANCLNSLISVIFKPNVSTVIFFNFFFKRSKKKIEFMQADGFNNSSISNL